MSRISYITPENFTEAQQRLFQNITSGKRGEGRAPEDLLNAEGGMSGPFNAWAQKPGVRRCSTTARRNRSF